MAPVFIHEKYQNDCKFKNLNDGFELRSFLCPHFGNYFFYVVFHSFESRTSFIKFLLLFLLNQT